VLASYIAKLLNADLEEIVDTKKRTGWMWYLIAGKDAAQKKLTKIQPLIHELSDYDIVCIGTPVWDFTMSSAIRTFLTNHEKKFPASLIFFCTQASLWADSTIQEMANIIGKKPITSIVCTSKEINKNTYQDYVESQLVAAWVLA
jgi:flavodoxin